MEQEPMRFTFMKFGGGALKDLSPPIVDLTDQRITELTLPGTIPFITVSALGKMTDRLEQIYKTAVAGNFQESSDMLEKILAEHWGIIMMHVPASAQGRSKGPFRELCANARKTLGRLTDPRMADIPIDPDESVKAELLAVGEILSGFVLEAVLDARGYAVQLLHGNGFMLGSVEANGCLYTEARYMRDESRNFLRHTLEERLGLLDQMVLDAGDLSLPRKKRLVMTPGFIGTDINDPTKTVNFGREASDLTAVEAATALSIKGMLPLVHFVKDVDPTRLIPGNWYDVRTMQAETREHLVGDSAIGAAIAAGIDGVIVDFVTGERHRIVCEIPDAVQVPDKK